MSTKRSRKPYTVAGAGRLTATIWKTGINVRSGNYAFNLIRTNGATGHVTQRFHPQDLLDFAKLIQVLAFTFVDDGCLESDLRRQLDRLQESLRTALDEVPMTRLGE